MQYIILYAEYSFQGLNVAVAMGGPIPATGVHMSTLTQFLRVGIGSALVAAATLVAAPAAQAQVRLKFGHIVGTDHPIHMGAQAMAGFVSQCTRGQVVVDIFPGGQMGNEGALIDQLRLGGVDFANSGASFLSRNFPHLGISSLPYIFRDRNQAVAYASSDVLRELMNGWEKATGQVLLSSYYASAFHVVAQTPMRTPADIRGKKIRIPDAPSWALFFNSVGANPVPMALGEVYLALRQGLLDGANLPLAVAVSIKVPEVAKVVNMTFHQLEMSMLLSGAQTRSRLNAEQWGCVQQAGKLYASVAQEETIKGEDRLRADLTARGAIQFVDVDVAAYQRAVASVIDNAVKAGTFPQALVDRVRAVK
jgi:TRAP-type C4-dicarboxylate transport system substrate-binding protein